MPAWGSAPLAPLLFSVVGWFGAVLIWAVLSLPSFVLVLCFASSRAWPLFGGVFVVMVFLPARLRVSFRGRRAPFCGWLGLFVSVLCLAGVGSPPLPVVASLPLRLDPCGVLAQFLRWSLPLGIWFLFVTAWLPFLTAGGVVVLCRPHFILSHDSKGLWPCVGFVLPSTP